MHGTYNVKFA
jgi:hypothetical protein